MSGQGPYYGQKAWFSIFHPEKIPSAIERYLKEVERVVSVIDSHLGKQGTEYLVGDRATYADLMFLPYHKSISLIVAPELDLTPWKNYNAWTERLSARPAVARVFAKWDKVISQG
jgi:glutathione S-transferase